MRITQVFIYLLFGFSSFSQGVWNQKANLPGPGRHGAVGFELGNYGYIGLGQINSGPQGDIEYQDMYRYDPTSNSWMRVDSFLLSENTDHLAIWAKGNKAYFGDVQYFRFEPDKNEYQTLLSEPISLSFTAHTEALGKEFFFLNDQVRWFYYGSEEWGIHYWPEVSQVYFEKAVTINETIYVTGSTFESSTIYSVNPVSLEIDSVTTAPFGPVYNFDMVELNGEIYYFFCGNNSTDASKSIFKYNLELNEWQQLEDFPGNGRRYYASFKLGNRYFVSTGTNGINHNDLWEYIPNDTSSVIIKPPVPNYTALAYPNPSNETITIEIKDYDPEAIYTIIITDRNGKNVGYISATDAAVKINCLQFEAGTYHYQLFKNEHTIKTGNLIIL